MEGFKEFQGKDLDDAIGQACSYYDTLREKLEIEIVSDSKSGIFGIVGARKAKIKARRVQLRTAVDSVLGRNRDGAGDTASPRAKVARPQQEKQGEKPARAVQSRGESRADSVASPQQPAEPSAPHAEQGRQDMAPADCAPAATGYDDADCTDTDTEGRGYNARQDDRAGDNGRKPRNQRPARPSASPPQSRSPRPAEQRHDARHDHRSPEFGYDGNSILSGQVLGHVADVEDDEQASFGPGNELPPNHDSYADRNAKPRRGRTPRPTQGPRPESASPRPVHSSVLAGTLDNDALNEDALSEGLPVVAFDQLDQERLSAISLEVVGRLVVPIVGDVPLAVELGDNRVNVVLDCGEDSGLLIGREGQTLASLQYLASRLVSRAMGAAVRVQLDAGEYRLRQDEKLRDLALALAERVRASGKSHSTRPLSSYHRRIVHMALQEAVDIQTRSSGDGALKRVVIQKKRGN